MAERKDGGPAFPQTTVEYLGGVPSVSVTGGASLRDVFAWQALQGICASGPSGSWTNARLAADAYALADAMLAERDRQ